MTLLKAGDSISGQEAKAQININGVIQDLFYAKKLEAKFAKEKVDFRSLGKRSKQKKTVGWEGTGTLTVYYVTSLFRKLAIDYIKTGKDIYFDLITVNEDPSSTIGKQTVALHGVNLDDTILTKFDVDAQVLDEEMPFTFDDADLLGSFNAPTE